MTFLMIKKGFDNLFTIIDKFKNEFYSYSGELSTMLINELIFYLSHLFNINEKFHKSRSTIAIWSLCQSYNKLFSKS